MTRATRFLTTSGLLLMGMCVSLLAGVILGNFDAHQRWEDWEIAANILKGGDAAYHYLGTTYWFYGSPIYPRLLAIVLRLTQGDTSAMLALHALIFGGTCVLVYLIAGLFVRHRLALVAALLAAFHPGNVIYTSKLHPHTLDVFLLMFSFLLICRLISASSIHRAIGTGLVVGLTVLSRGTFLPFMALWAIWFLFGERRQLRRGLAVVAATTLSGVVMLTPILVSGYVRYGRLIPLRTDVGVNFWIGNNTEASGTNYTQAHPPIPVVDTLPDGLKAHLTGLNEVEQTEIFTGLAFEFIRSDPKAFVILFAKKLGYFWWFSPHAGLHYPESWRTLNAPYYGVILLMTIAGLCLAVVAPSFSLRRGVVLFLLLAVSYSVTQALFYVEGRHRWEIQPLCFIFAAVGLSQVLRFAGRTRTTGSNILEAVHNHPGYGE